MNLSFDGIDFCGYVNRVDKAKRVSPASSVVYYSRGQALSLPFGWALFREEGIDFVVLCREAWNYSFMILGFSALPRCGFSFHV